MPQEPTSSPSDLHPRWLLPAALGVGLIGFALLWTLTPLRHAASVQGALDYLHNFGQDPLGPVFMVVAYALLGLLSFPFTVLATVTGILFGPGLGLVVNLVGTAVSASLVFWVGRWAGTEAVRRFGGSTFHAVNQRLSRRSLLAMVVLRNIPIAPFTIINLVCGATAIAFRDYFIGTMLGMAPGLAALAVFGDQLEQFVRNPSVSSISWVIAAVALMVALVLGIERFVDRQQS